MTDRTIVKFMHNGIAYVPGEWVPQEEYDRVVAELEKKTQEYNAKSALVSGITIEWFIGRKLS